VFATSLIVTAAVWAASHAVVRAQDDQRFTNSTIRARRALETRLQAQVGLLRTTAGMFTSQREISPKEFAAFVATIDVPRNYPGMRGLGFSLRVPEGQLDAVEADQRRSGRKNFRIYPSGAGEQHAIVLLEPEDSRNRIAFGFNMHSEPTRREAMDRARDTGQPALSGRVRLVQEGPQGSQPGILMYFPVYRGGDPGNATARRQQLVGFVYSPFRAGDLISSVADVEPGLSISVYDGRALDTERLLYSNTPERHAPEARGRTVRLEFQGRPWLIQYFTTPQFTQSSAVGLVAYIPVVGLLLSLLLGALSLAQSRTNRALVEQTEELHRREYQQRLLAQAGALLAESLDYEETLARVAELAVPSFADWCAVDLAEPDGGVRRLAVAHVRPEKVHWARELEERYPVDPNAATGVPQVIRTGKSELYPTIPREMLVAAAKDEAHMRVIDEIGFSSAIVVPMTARGRTLGAITFVWAESGFHYDQDDLKLAEEIGARAAVAVDNAQLFREAEIEGRIASSLERAARTLAGQLDQERLVQYITDEGTAITGAKFGAFFYTVTQPDGQRLQLYTLAGAQRSDFEQFGMPRETAVFGPSLSGRAVVRIGNLSEDPRYGQNAPHAGLPHGHLPVVSYLGVPVVSRSGETLGAMMFGHPEPNVFSEREERLAVGLAGHAAVALDNARLFAEKEAEIDERRRAEERVRQLNENLERIVEERTAQLTATNKELEAFAYSVSHDLRAPLRSVDGFSKALLEDYGDKLDETGIGYLDRVRKASRRMDELITAMLNLSRLTRAELNRQPVDATEIASEAARDAVRPPDKEIEIVVEPGMSADADPRMLRIVFDNLIGNAIKFSAVGEHPRVEVGRDGDAFFVRDNGVGFNPAYANKLFAPFERLHPNNVFPGTGIGLATVQRIAQRHGGRAWAHGEEGKGATFFFTLR